MSTPQTSDRWFDITNREAYERCPPWVEQHRWREYREALHAAENFEQRAGPVQVDIELNGGCNMACPFCTHGFEKVPNIKLGRDCYVEALQQARQMGATSVKLNGINEPMLLPDLDWYVRAASDREFVNIYFVTNGLALRGAAVDRLLATRLTRISVSLDAVTSATYDLQRKSQAFEQVRNNTLDFIRRRDEAGTGFPLVIVTFLRNELNHHEEAEFVRQWAGVADIVSVQRANAVPGLSDQFVSERGSTSACKFPFKQLMVDSSGVVLPCCKLHGRELSLGVMPHTALREAWARGQWIRDMHAAGEWDCIDACSRCLGGRP